MKGFISIFGLLGIFFISCHKPASSIQSNDYLTKNVIIMVMDGARYSETWGEANHTYIPYLSGNIAPKSVVCTNFFNNGATYTIPGHLSIISGQYYPLNNNGNELPPFPTIFHYFNKTYPSKNSWIITSKDKLEVLANTSNQNFHNVSLPNTNCGINGLGSGYRHDDITLNVALDILTNDQPTLTLINFREPDYTAHQNDTMGYLNEIAHIDSLMHVIFSFVENDPHYKNKTTIFITNDHGRHDDLNGGFSGHGDNCNGCKHLMFFAFGPDFKENEIITHPYEQIDIAHTIATLLGFNLPNSKGKIMNELFK